MGDHKKILKSIGEYYTDKVSKYGVSAQGVDWNSEKSQELRFHQLLKIIDRESGFSLLDFGCGYGALLGYLNKLKYIGFEYTGFDISKEMIEQAQKLFGKGENINWEINLEGVEKNDFIVASGIFNVMLEHDKKKWEEYIFDTLNQFNDLYEIGFAFNMLTSYSDKEYMKDYLYYAEPERIFTHCKKHFSRNIALLHDYDLYEFTVLVRKIEK